MCPRHTRQLSKTSRDLRRTNWAPLLASLVDINIWHEPKPLFRGRLFVLGETYYDPF